MRTKAYILLALVCCLGACKTAKNPASYEVWGIDVSRHQHRVDWKKLCTEQRPAFVFLKATEGTLIADPTFHSHARELERHGILWGAYHFFGHRTSGKKQARNFIRTSGLRKGNLRPVLDIEPHRFMKDASRSVREAKAFCREIKRYYGVNPIIYCSSHFYTTYLKKDFRPDEYMLWIADYNGSPDHLPWKIWQHTDRYRLPGIRGSVDRNVLRGDRQDLQKLVLR